MAKRSNDQQLPECSERIELREPAGGYAIAYFADAERKPCVKSQAVHIEIVEFDQAGHAVRRTYSGPTREG